MSFKSIRESINSLAVDRLDAGIITTLRAQLDYASVAKLTSFDLSEYLKSDNDVLDSNELNPESKLWSDIREIQDTIICYYGV